MMASDSVIDDLLLEFFISKYFFRPFLPPSYLRPPLFAAMATVRLLGKPGLTVHIQLLPDGSNGAVNLVLLQLALPDDDYAPAK